MALKVFQLLSFFSLLFLALASIGHAKRDIPSVKKSSPFEFIKELEGCQKGSKTKGIHQLKNYLQRFGYLDHLNQTQANNDNFDDALESAIKTYQQNYHINPTGILDATTVSKMTRPRCGVPDIINGTNTMQRPHKETHDSSSKSIHTVSHYSFFRGNPRWPPSKTTLTYRFLPDTPSIAVRPVASAFQKWASATQFRFAQVPYNQNSDLVIGFRRGYHDDPSPFDGPGGAVAHAFAPTIGLFHYDADETWVNGAVPGAIDLESVALHEIGHLLGLDHSADQSAIMYSEIGPGTVKNVLQADDIQGIRALYNV